MPTPADFLQYSLWTALAFGVCGVLTLLAFVFKWGLRFNLVGGTGLLGFVTLGLLSLSLFPLSKPVIPGAIRYSLVYDSSGTQAVIAVPPKITKPQLEATLQQAAINLFTPGRGGRDSDQLTIRARTILHSRQGASQPLYLGQIQRSLFEFEDPNMTISLFDENWAQLPPSELESKPESS